MEGSMACGAKEKLQVLIVMEPREGKRRTLQGSVLGGLGKEGDII
jgi:hypothetical protein